MQDNTNSKRLFTPLNGMGILPEKNQNNASGHRRHNASTTTSVRPWFLLKMLINIKEEYSRSCCECKHLVENIVLYENMDLNWRRLCM